MNPIFNIIDLKKQLRALPEKTAAWKYADSLYRDEYGPVIDLPHIFLREEPVEHCYHDITGKVYITLWVEYICGYGFDVYQKTYFTADISEQFDQEYQTIICSTQSWQKVLRTCRDYYRKLKREQIEWQNNLPWFANHNF